MNKKKIGALLVGATLLVGAMGSFAYFTHKTSVIGSNGDNGLQAITITNGNVQISAAVTNHGENKLDWSYDVAKLSTDDNKKLNDGIKGEDIVKFENKHRSPDINALNKSKVNPNNQSDLKRAEIGSALPTPINFTRPGDAIVLGVPQRDKDGNLIIDEETGLPRSGLVITNQSNLTVRVRLVAIESDKETSKLTAMENAGWILYINGEATSFDALRAGVEVGIVGPGNETTTTTIPDIRFELPLDRKNPLQNAVGAGEEEAALDLSEIIEIQATQENNTDWEEMDQKNHGDENN